MPETGYSYADEYDNEARDDYLVRMPRGAVRPLEDKGKKADTYEQMLQQTRERHGDDAFEQFLGLAESGDTPLEPGEENLTAERRGLTAQAPPDQPQPGDPYKEAGEAMQQVLADGGQEKHAFAAAFATVVNAAHRGDLRVLLEDQRTGYPGQSIPGGGLRCHATRSESAASDPTHPTTAR